MWAGRLTRAKLEGISHLNPPPRKAVCVTSELARRAAAMSAPPVARTKLGSGRLPHDDPLLRVEPARYVEALAGLSVSRHRKVQCPFYDDRTPSLHVYREPDRGWFCFGCGRGGSVYDFAALLWGRETRGADFALLRSELQRVFLGE